MFFTATFGTRQDATDQFSHCTPCPSLVHLALLPCGWSRQTPAILTAFDGEDGSQFESSPDGHACQRAADMILGRGVEGNPLLVSDDLGPSSDELQDVLPQVRVDSGHGSMEGDGGVEVG